MDTYSLSLVQNSFGIPKVFLDDPKKVDPVDLGTIDDVIKTIKDSIDKKYFVQKMNRCVLKNADYEIHDIGLDFEKEKVMKRNIDLLIDVEKKLIKDEKWSFLKIMLRAFYFAFNGVNRSKVFNSIEIAFKKSDLKTKIINVKNNLKTASSEVSKNERSQFVKMNNILIDSASANVSKAKTIEKLKVEEGILITIENKLQEIMKGNKFR